MVPHVSPWSPKIAHWTLCSQGGTHCGFSPANNHPPASFCPDTPSTTQGDSSVFLITGSLCDSQCSLGSFLCILIPSVFPGFYFCFHVHRSSWPVSVSTPGVTCEHECICSVSCVWPSRSVVCVTEQECGFPPGFPEAPFPVAFCDCVN